MSQYDVLQIGNDSKIAWKRFKEALKLNSSILVPSGHHKEVIKLEVIQLTSFKSFTTNENQERITKMAMGRMLKDNNKFLLQMYCLKADRILDKGEVEEAFSIINRAKDMAVNKFKLGKNSRDYFRLL